MPATSRLSPAISVVMPTHNRPALLQEAVESILLQTHSDWEVLIVDDASEPPAKAPDDERFRTIRSEKTRGGAGSKNLGVTQAQAPIVAFLDDDDLYDPRYLEKALEVLEDHPDIDVIFMGVEWFGSNAKNGRENCARAMKQVLGRTLQEVRTPFLTKLDGRSLFISLLNSVPMAFQRPVVRRSAFEVIGGYQPDILLWDCDWALRAALRAPCALLVEGLYRQRADGQGYASLRTRSHEQSYSNVIMKKRLLDTVQSPIERKALRSSLSDVWFNIGWQHYQEGEYSNAIKSCIKSLCIAPRLAQGSLAARALLASFGIGKRTQ